MIAQKATFHKINSSLLAEFITVQQQRETCTRASVPILQIESYMIEEHYKYDEYGAIKI